MAKISLFTVIFGYQRTSTNALAGPWRSGAGGFKSLMAHSKNRWKLTPKTRTRSLTNASSPTCKR